MSTHQSKSSSLSSSNLILRIYRSDQISEERYLAPGLSIGRSEANQIRTDDPAVARAHARVEMENNGQYILKTLENDLTIEVQQEQVNQVTLAEGKQFRIGNLKFECINGLRQSSTKIASTQPACPYCEHKATREIALGPQRCEQCQESIIVFPYQEQSRHLIAVPATYGRYQATQFVARGGMAYVLKGIDPNAPAGKNEVAIKILMPSHAGVSRPAMLRFKQEIATMRQIDNPRVMPLLNYGNSQSFNYLILPWIGGRSLRDKIRQWNTQKKPLDFQEAIQLFLPICEGVQAIHAAQIVHRDLKPANILFNDREEPIIGDLGIARSDDQKTAITQTGMILGTSDYMAPEQRSNPENIDKRVDLFALGVIFYETLTLQRPSGAWQPASTINPSVPEDFDRLISALLWSVPNNRISTIDLVIVWLKTFTNVVSGPNNLDTVPAKEENKNEPQSLNNETQLLLDDAPSPKPSKSYTTGKFIRKHVLDRFFSKSNSAPDSDSNANRKKKSETNAGENSWGYGVIILIIVYGYYSSGGEHQPGSKTKPARFGRYYLPVPATPPLTPSETATSNGNNKNIDPLPQGKETKQQTDLQGTLQGLKLGPQRPNAGDTKFAIPSGFSSSLEIATKTFRDQFGIEPNIVNIKDKNADFSVMTHRSHLLNKEYEILVFKTSSNFERTRMLVLQRHNAEILSEPESTYQENTGAFSRTISAKAITDSDLIIKFKIIHWKGTCYVMVAKGKGTFVYQAETEKFLNALQIQ